MTKDDFDSRESPVQALGVSSTAAEVIRKSDPPVNARQGSGRLGFGLVRTVLESQREKRPEGLLSSRGSVGAHSISLLGILEEGFSAHAGRSARPGPGERQDTGVITLRTGTD